MEVKGTIAIDSLGELARLTFAKTMKKTADQMENLRAMNDYPGMAERINILSRKLKEVRDAGWEVVFTAHDSIDKIYLKGSGMNSEPIAVKGRPGMPGNAGPDEMMKAMDNIFHTKWNGQKVQWVAQTEAVGPGCVWEVKDRFGAKQIQNGYLPNSYSEIQTLALANPATKPSWNPPYLWMVYGPPGSFKTTSLLTFPRPLHIFDIDKGLKSISHQIEASKDIFVKTYNSEEGNQYDQFVIDIMSVAFEAPAVNMLKKQFPGAKG